MGSIRSKSIKRAAREIVGEFSNEMSIDFDTNKSFIREKGIVEDKHTRNAVAGYTVRLMRQRAMHGE
ncbi:MAG: 30S ribosomal protein S17e [Candidatus Aenigmatarchaeota archaeon]